MYHNSPMTRKNFKCIYNFKINTNKWIKWMKATEIVNGKVLRMLNLKNEKDLEGQLQHIK